MGYTKRIGRLGGLAVGLGIGAALAATPGVAAADTDVVVPVDGGASAVLGGDTYVPFLAETNVTTVVGPLDTQVIGDQEFNVDGLGGTPIDGFEAEVQDTTFIFGTSDQYIDVLGNVAGKVPPEVGSIINTINYGGGFENAYSDIVGSAPGSAPADEFITPFGDFAVPTGIVEALGPGFFIPSEATISSSAASAIDPSSLTSASDLSTLTNALDPSLVTGAADLSSDLSSLLGLF